MDNLKAFAAYVYAGFMAVLTAVAEQAGALEPDRLVWMLGFAGALFGAAFLPSAQLWRTGLKLFIGWIIAGVLSTPLAASHYGPEFMNVHVWALWLGFAGPALMMASLQGHALITRMRNRGKGA